MQQNYQQFLRQYGQAWLSFIHTIANNFSKTICMYILQKQRTRPAKSAIAKALRSNNNKLTNYIKFYKYEKTKSV